MQKGVTGNFRQWRGREDSWWCEALRAGMPWMRDAGRGRLTGRGRCGGEPSRGSPAEAQEGRVGGEAGEEQVTWG